MPIDYHSNNTTNTGEFIISHSMLCKLDPVLGGHPKIFYKALTEPAEEKATFNNGNILHHWMEHKDNYVTSELTKPGESGSNWAETFYNLYSREGWRNNAIFLNISSHETKVEKASIPLYSDLFQKINKRPFSSEEEFVLFISLVRFSRTVADYNKTIKIEATLLEHFNKLTDYINFLQEATGKIILTNSERDTLTNCQQALRDHPIANLLMETPGESEYELFWKSDIRHEGEVIGSLNRKGKIDKFIIDHDNKKVIIIDWKTSNPPAAHFTYPIEGAYWKYRNGRQLTGYADGLFRLRSEFQGYDCDLINVVVQTNNEYPVIIYETHPHLFYRFRIEIKDLEERAFYHMTSNQWTITKEEADNNSIIIN